MKSPPGSHGGKQKRQLPVGLRWVEAMDELNALTDKAAEGDGQAAEQLLFAITMSVEYLNIVATNKPTAFQQAASTRLEWPVMAGMHQGQKMAMDVFLKRIGLSTATPEAMIRRPKQKQQWKLDLDANQIAVEFMRDAHDLPRWKTANFGGGLKRMKHDPVEAKRTLQVLEQGVKTGKCTKATLALWNARFEVSERKMTLQRIPFTKANAGKWAWQVYKIQCARERSLEAEEQDAKERKALHRLESHRQQRAELQEKLEILRRKKPDEPDNGAVERLKEAFRSIASR